MRVLHYVDAESISWAVPYIEHIKSLEALGVENILLCRSNGELERLAAENNIKTFTFKPLVSNLPLLSHNFVKVVKNISPDIIHTRLSSAAGIAGFWKNFHHVPVISTFDKPAKSKYYSHSNFCISCAEWLKNYMVKVQKIDAEKITVIHNPVNSQRFSRDEEARKEFRKILGLSENDILFSGIGIYVYRKGFDVLIKAFSRVKNLYNGEKNIHLALIGGEVGEKNMRESYLKLAEELNIKIIMPEKFVKDVRKWLWASDILVMPSREEGFSIALLEGLAAGLPVIVSDIEPFTEIISEKQNNGLISKKDDYESFAASMLKMLNARDEGRKIFVKNSLEMIKKNFTVEAAAEKTFEIYYNYDLKRKKGVRKLCQNYSD